MRDARFLTRPWTDAEIQTLRDLYPTHTGKAIAAKLGRSLRAVRTRCWMLGMRDKPRLPHRLAWADAEIAMVREAYSAAKMSPVDLDDLAGRIGRPKGSICRKAQELGLTNPKRRKKASVSLKVVTAMTPEDKAAACSATIRRYLAEHGHPRGMLGRKHSPETLALLAEKARAKWRDPACGLNSEAARSRRSALMRERHRSGLFRPENAFSRCKRGYREDIGIFVRSAWEANYARYLNMLMAKNEILCWDYEPEQFLFPIRGDEPTTYTPDFLVWLPDMSHEWHEVKGWLTANGSAALRRMGECYPRERVILRDEVWFGDIWRTGAARQIAGWEPPA